MWVRSAARACNEVKDAMRSFLATPKMSASRWIRSSIYCHRCTSERLLSRSSPPRKARRTQRATQVPEFFLTRGACPGVVFACCGQIVQRAPQVLFDAQLCEFLIDLLDQAGRALIECFAAGVQACLKFRQICININIRFQCHGVRCTKFPPRILISKNQTSAIGRVLEARGFSYSDPLRGVGRLDESLQILGASCRARRHELSRQ